jgi:pre-rRNA-processing protein IPI3
MFHTQIIASKSTKPTQFSQALTHASFPDSMLDEGLAELASFGQPGNEVRVSAPSKTQSAPVEDSSKSQVTGLENEISVLKKKVAVNETARHNADDEVVQLRSDLANLQDYINELHEKQEAARKAKVLRRARKQEHETKRREAWLAAEKKGLSGDAAVQQMDVDAGTSDSDDQGDE